MPVIYCFKTNEFHYCEITPLWDSMYYDEMRYIINYILAP